MRWPSIARPLQSVSAPLLSWEHQWRGTHNIDNICAPAMSSDGLRMSVTEPASWKKIELYKPWHSKAVLQYAMGLDSEASRPPDTRDMARECRVAPSLQEMYGAPAVYTPVTRAAACRFGSIATGASSSPRAVFFHDLSIFLRRPVISDSSHQSMPNCRMWLKRPWDDRRFVRHLGDVR